MRYIICALTGLVRIAASGKAGSEFSMTNTYLLIKQVHISCVVCSGSLFALRAFWRWRSPALLRLSWVRILPHLVDTLLLLSALTLAYRSGQYPFVQTWLSAKLLALCVYIVLGSLALKRLKRGWLSYTTSIAALCCYAYIVMVAVTRTIWPIF